MSYRTPLAGLLLTTAALTIPCASAYAGPGYGYDDPRSAQLTRVADVAALPGGHFLISRYNPGSVLEFAPGRRLTQIAGGGRRKPGSKPVDARDVSLFALNEIEPFPGGGFAGAADGIVAVRDGKAVKIAGIDARGLGAAADGSLLVAPRYDSRIVEITPSGEQRTVAGTDGSGLSPDGSVAAESPLLEVTDVKPTADGGFIFAETAADYAAIRRVSADGRLTTLAGGLRVGFGGDGGPAVDATLESPQDIDVAPDGGILIADGNRIRRIDPGGNIATVAGTGDARYNGDGIPATDANLAGSLSVAANEDGSFLIGDFGDDEENRVRYVSTEGTIRTLAGMPAPVSCEDAPYNGIQGGPGNDRIGGGKLRDLIRGEDGENRLSGRGGSDCLVGGIVDDLLAGGSGSDVIDAGNGGDEVTGDGGRDFLIGQDGDDLMTGGEGRDELYGGHADDRLDGGPGNDRVSGYDGADRLNGGGGDDYVDAQSNERESYGGPADIVSCGPGEDTVKANTYDRVKKNCEHLEGAIAGNAPD